MSTIWMSKTRCPVKGCKNKYINWAFQDLLTTQSNTRQRVKDQERTTTEKMKSWKWRFLSLVTRTQTHWTGSLLTVCKILSFFRKLDMKLLNNICLKFIKWAWNRKLRKIAKNELHSIVYRTDVSRSKDTFVVDSKLKATKLAIKVSSSVTSNHWL